MEKNIVQTLKPSIESIVKKHNLNLFDLEFVKETGLYFLRVSIERDDGSMDFETCEVITKEVSEYLDKTDPIPQQYILEVCSPGAERPIRNLQEFKNSLNKYVTIYLDEKINKKDVFTGDLIEVDDTCLTLSYKDKNILKKIKIELSHIIKAHLAIKF